MHRDLPSLNALRAFEAAARLRSISLAAEELHVTHGAVSRQVRLLAEDLRVVLFTKEGRGIKLTDAGLRLRDACAEAFESLRSVSVELQRQTAEAPFVLGCPGSLLARWFIPRLDRLNRALPELRLQLSASESELDPWRAGLNAILWFAEPPWPAGMQAFDLVPERMGPVLSPRLERFAGLTESPVSQLLNEPLLHTSSRPQAWPNWARSLGLSAQRLRYGQGFEHLYYLLEAAIAGLGVAIAPEILIRDDLAAGRLVAPWGFIESGARLVLWAPTRWRNPRAERLAQWLRKQLVS